MRLGIIGDVHLRWGAEDTAALDAEGLDAVLFVGDLGGYSHRGALRVARAISTLRTPALVVPGNHDGARAAQLVAEVVESDAAIALTAGGMAARVRELREALGRCRCAGTRCARSVAPRELASTA